MTRPVDRLRIVPPSGDPAAERASHGRPSDTKAGSKAREGRRHHLESDEGGLVQARWWGGFQGTSKLALQAPSLASTARRAQARTHTATLASSEILPIFRVSLWKVYIIATGSSQRDKVLSSLSVLTFFFSSLSPSPCLTATAFPRSSPAPFAEKTPRKSTASVVFPSAHHHVAATPGCRSGRCCLLLPARGPRFI